MKIRRLDAEHDLDARDRGTRRGGHRPDRAWAERRGFRPHTHLIRSRLDLTAFDVARHRPAVTRAEASGLRFRTPAGGDRR